MKKIRYILVLSIGCLLFWVVLGLGWYPVGLGYTLKEFKIWTAWIAAIGLALLTIFASYKNLRHNVTFASFYFFILLASYLLGLFYPFFVPYGWFVIPVVANFFVGQFIREVGTTVKIIIVCFFLLVGVVLGLLNVSLVYEAFLQHGVIGDDPSDWVLTLIFGYLVLHISLGIGVSCVGIAIREHLIR